MSRFQLGCSSSKQLVMRPLSSGGLSSGRFSDEIEDMISRSAAAAGRKKGGTPASANGKEQPSVESEGVGAGDVGEDGAVGVTVTDAKAADEKMSARAQKFRAMITKFRPEKKPVVVKVSFTLVPQVQLLTACRAHEPVTSHQWLLFVFRHHGWVPFSSSTEHHELVLYEVAVGASR